MEDRDAFQELKAICVPLLAHSRLDSKDVPVVLGLLDSLAKKLSQLHSSRVDLKPSLLSYTFFPLSTILTRHQISAIPEQVLERTLNVFEVLFGWWWWTCDDGVWDQVLMLACSVVGGLSAGTKGKGKDRDDETKDAAVKLILRLLRNDARNGVAREERTRSRIDYLRTHAQSPKLTPVLGMTIDSLIATLTSAHTPLQVHSLEAIGVVIWLYVPDSIVPSILPGVVSAATRIALGQPSGKSHTPKERPWQKGVVVGAALAVIDAMIVRAMGDEICLKAKLVHDLNDLDDIAELVSEDAAGTSVGQRRDPDNVPQPYETARTPAWLKATGSQILIALNTLMPLLNHPSSPALHALAILSSSLLSKTRLALPDLRPLLLTFLLALSSSSKPPSVSMHAQRELLRLLDPRTDAGRRRHLLMQILTKHTASNLSALPHLISSRSESKVIHIARQIEAACQLGSPTLGDDLGVAVRKEIKKGISHILGPTGSIEKWGYRLLSAIQFSSPSAIVPMSGTGIAGFLESSTADDPQLTFPDTRLSSLSTQEAQSAVENTLRVLGSAAEEGCLFSIEWFVRVGTSHNEDVTSSAAALWCACLLLEGVIHSSQQSSTASDSMKWERGRRLEKLARWISRTVSELWEQPDDDLVHDAPDQRQENDANDLDQPVVEFKSGTAGQIQTRFDLLAMSTPTSNFPSNQTEQRSYFPILQRSFALQLLASSSQILLTRFMTTLIHSLYPLLHSLISPSPFLSFTAQVSLTRISQFTGHATPSFLLLANFDYALDSVSRRLTKRWLDVDAARVLGGLVRVVGGGVVVRAGDVVEECFKVLDDFHGYAVVVDGIVGALVEIVRVVGEEGEKEHSEQQPGTGQESALASATSISDDQHFTSLLEWLEDRKTPSSVDTDEAPSSGKGKSKEALDREQSTGDSDPNDETAATPTSSLAATLLTRSFTLLTHPSSLIRTRILTLLTLAVSTPTLFSRPSSYLPHIHKAWPFIINRLKEGSVTQRSTGLGTSEVVSTAAGLVEALVRTQGGFVGRKVWEDVWPAFKSLLSELEKNDQESALTVRPSTRGFASVGTASRYTHSHRLYVSMLRTMTAVYRQSSPLATRKTASMGGEIKIPESTTWEVLLLFRRFLSGSAHEELQASARELYTAIAEGNADAVWLVLVSTAVDARGVECLQASKWNIATNAERILSDIGGDNCFRQDN